MIARINHVTRNTKEMQNYSGDKSIFGVLEQILLKSCFEHGQLLKDKTKVSVRDKTSSPQQAQCPYASGTLIRINFHPQTAEKMAPHCMVRLDLVNCSSTFLSTLQLNYSQQELSHEDRNFLLENGKQHTYTS